MIKKIKKNKKLVIGSFLLGALIFSTITGVVAYSVYANNVIYDNTTSGLTSTNVKDAIDELYTKVGNTECKKDFRKVGDTQTGGYICEPVVPPADFSTDSWETIVAAVEDDDTDAYNVGDTKTVDLGTFGTHTLRIANKSTPSECAGNDFSKSACGFVLEFADVITSYNMNPTNTSVGGWGASAMRTYVNNDIYNALPATLKNAIIDTTVVFGQGSTTGSSTDKLYLLSTHEIYEDVDGNPNSGISFYDKSYNKNRRLDYYESINVTTNAYTGAIKNYNNSSYYWWTRSAYQSDGFYLVTTSGDWNTGYTPRNSCGVSPAFRLG